MVWKNHSVHLLYQYLQRFSSMVHPESWKLSQVDTQRVCLNDFVTDVESLVFISGAIKMLISLKVLFLPLLLKFIFLKDLGILVRYRDGQKHFGRETVVI